MPTNDERRKIAETLRSGVGTTDYMSDGAFIEWLFSVVGRSCDGHILDSLADLIEPEEPTCRNVSTVPWKFTCSECHQSWRKVKGNGEFGFCPSCNAKVIE